MAMGIPVWPNRVVVDSLLGKPNTKKLTRIYNEAFEQISSLWKMLPESARTELKSEADESESMEVEGSVSTKSKIKDLEDRVNSLKGKQTSYKEKMAKKKLKNQLKKKKKSEEKNLLKEEMRQKKKELKEQKLAEKMTNGGVKESALEKRISQAAEDCGYSSDDENESEEPEEEPGDIEMPPPKQTKKKLQRKKKKLNIEELSQAGAHEDGSEQDKPSGEGLSKKKLKYLNKKEQQAEKKREKRKQWRLKKKEETESKAKALIKTEKAPVVPKPESKDTEVMYNKIDLEGENAKKKFKKEKPRTEKDPVKALNKIEELNKKITDLKEMGDEEKAAALKSKESWKAAILRADGVKVKDNVTLLKKTIKKKEKQKTKSKMDWAKRKEVTEKKIADAQKKRKENIQKKKKDKKQNKIKKSIKKGRVVI